MLPSISPRCVSLVSRRSVFQGLLVVAGLWFLPLHLVAEDAAQPRASATDWPQFKGDAARSGDNPQADLQFPLQRIVAVRLPAPIYASPAVRGESVYIQDARGHLVCVNSRTNTVVWSAENGGINNCSSPAIFEDRLFIGSTAGHLGIYDARTGQLIRKVPAPGGVLTAPAVANGAIYFSTFNGKLTKISPDGDEIWTFSGGESSITEFAVKGSRIIFFAGTTRANAYRLHDHGTTVEMLERDRPSGGFFAPTGGPVFLTDEDFASQSYDSESGWFHAFGKPLESGSNDSRVTASVRGNRLYRGSKAWEFDPAAKTFKELAPSDPQSLYDGGFHSSPALAKDVFVIGSEQGVVHFMPLDWTVGPQGLTRKAAFQFSTEGAGRPNGAVSSSPAVVSGQVFFGGEDGILYGLGTGKEAAIVTAPFPANTSPAKARDLLAGPEWVTSGGDMGFSCVAENSPAKPPFRVEWRTRVWSTFKGNMVVGGGRVYAAGRMGPLMALDARTGEILWKTHHAGIESRVSPTYDDGRLYILRVQGGLKSSPYFRGWFGGPNGEGLWCHDARTGETLWHKPIPTAYHFNSDGLVVDAGRVFACRAGSDNRLEAVAFDGKTGEEVWTTVIDGIPATHGPRDQIQPRRFSGVISNGLWCVSISATASLPGATLALETKGGQVVWRNDERFIENRSRIAARKGTLVVFNLAGSHGFEAASGKPLWSEAVLRPPEAEGQTKTSFYMQALTDRFLESQGGADVFKISGCIFPVYINGLWYSHTTNGTHVMHARNEEKTIWSRTFLSHACPSPVPAYDRLYYAPNSEGVVYCFVNETPVAE